MLAGEMEAGRYKEKPLAGRTIAMILAKPPRTPVEVDPDDPRVLVISRADLIATKRASGRPQDLADLGVLEAGDSL